MSPTDDSSSALGRVARTLAVVVALLLVGGMVLAASILYQQQKKVEAEKALAEFPAERDASELKLTDVIPFTTAPLTPGRNYVYCPTMQIAWDDLRNEVGGDPQLAGNPPIAAGLNGLRFPWKSLSPDSYVAHGGWEKDGIREKIIAEMGKKFPGVTPRHGPPSGENRLITYAFLQKDLPFAERFNELPEPLVFHAADGDVPVAGFGFKEFSYARDRESIKQVDVLYYASNDDFVLRFRPKRDEIVLAEVPPAATLDETMQAVQKRIAERQRGLDSSVHTRESLMVPRLSLNVVRKFDELTGKKFTNPGKGDWEIREALQSVRFLFNERGAKLQSEAKTATTKTAEVFQFRHFVFDRPFLLWLQEKDAEQPYLVLWIGNAELMERR